MTCDEVAPHIAAYHDGEIDALHALQIEEHLRSCDSCSARLENLRALSRVTKSAYFSAPPDLRANVLGAVHIEGRERNVVHARFRSASWLTRGLALAAALLLGFFVARALYRPSIERTLITQLTDSHIRSLIGTHLIDVPSSDSHTVRPWFEGKLDFAPPVEDLSSESFPLVGGRVDYIAGRSAAVLVYQRRQHFINLFIWPKTGEEPQVTEPPQRGYNVLHWTSGGLTYWALSEIAENDLRNFAIKFTAAR